MNKHIPFTKNEKRGCILFLYFLLSYPLNWLYLTYVLIPFDKWGGSTENWDKTGPILLILSPVTLPVEILTTFLGLIVLFLLIYHLKVDKEGELK